MWYVLLRQYKDPKPAQAALRSRFLWGVGPKAPDCGRRISPQKPSQTRMVKKSIGLDFRKNKSVSIAAALIVSLYYPKNILISNERQPVSSGEPGDA